MAVAYGQTITAWGAFGAGTQTSGSFTGSAGDFLAEVFFDGAGSGLSRTYGGSLNTPVEGATVNDTTDGNTLGIAGINNITGGSQTLFVTGSQVSGFAIEYSGVSTVSYVASHPLSTTTPAGSAVAVPSGAILVAWTAICSGTGTAITPSVSGTVTPSNRGSGTNTTNYCWGEWVGTGTTVTPTFAGASGDYVIFQILLSPPSANNATIAWTT